MKGARGATKGHKPFVARLVPFNATTNNLIEGRQTRKEGQEFRLYRV